MKYNITNTAKNNCTIEVGNRHLEPGETRRNIDEKEINEAVKRMARDGMLRLIPSEPLPIPKIVEIAAESNLEINVPFVPVTDNIVVEKPAELTVEFSEGKKRRRRKAE